MQRLRADHAAAVLAFELANRGYFAASISDRGDEFFDQFAERHSALLAEQEAGIGAFYVLVAEDGSVLGRFNLVFGSRGPHSSLGHGGSRSDAARRAAAAMARPEPGELASELDGECDGSSERRPSGRPGHAQPPGGRGCAAGYGTGVDLDVIRAWWSLRSLLAVRWLIEHGFDPSAPGCEVDVLRSRR